MDSRFPILAKTTLAPTVARFVRLADQRMVSELAALEQSVR